MADARWRDEDSLRGRFFRFKDRLLGPRFMTDLMGTPEYARAVCFARVHGARAAVRRLAEDPGDREAYEAAVSGVVAIYRVVARERRLARLAAGVHGV